MNDSSRTIAGGRPVPRGACPGVAAPLASGDGLLLRLRHPVGGLTPAQARAVADTARRCGNSALELTSRGNLQLRGVAGDALPAAQARLVAAGVADDDPGREAVRNVLVAPASDLDPQARADVTGLGRAVAGRIAGDPALRGLPAKTGVVIDGGGVAGIPGVYADVRVDPVAVPDGVGYRVAAAGRGADAVILGWARAEDVPGVVAGVLGRLAGIGGATPPRMAAALAERGADAFRGVPGLQTLDADTHGMTTASGPCAPGVGPAGAWVHAVFPFGALDADTLDGLAAIAEGHAGAASASLRLTPWRSVMLAGAGDDALAPLNALGAITAADDPRLGLGACVGAPGCASGSTPTRGDAAAMERMAPTLLAAGERLHVSGCGKGCGAPPTASIMLVAAEGRYAMAVTGSVAGAPDWPPAPAATVRARIAALDAVYARRRQQGESLEQLIHRLGRATVVRAVNEESERG
ncbi:precorrin-3B synthase [Aquisalimonas lutea]|uniref:precorrin-3B synthase n=1 Tax=Aquisalimonas lutea TaxID=1327750 RepID=UPI0025B50278|nr:precorrin-3B synthase [Aquisalimonas lutea]MDN3516465.1 precorrin-3B synthase [Aquisalimonas lutea]